MERDGRVHHRVVRETTRLGSGVRELVREDLPPSETIPGGRKIGLFIDGDNLASTIHRLGYRETGRALDFDKLLHWVKDGGNELVEMNYYCAFGSVEGNKVGYETFLGKLMDFGFKIVKIPDKYLRNGKRKKAPIDSVITRDITKSSARLDEVVLISGDGDYGYTLEDILAEGKTVRIISGRRSLGIELARLRDSELPLSVVYVEDIFQQLSMEKLLRPKKAGPVLVVNNGFNVSSS